ncbi:uncharacterized protein BXZ73DRAFT_96020 [Epithele typhae]|uniref:uncharacterized protein n=1 Tax=Epithele typhae TaxID=378194 RepID=UPI0020072A4D|nr:uncharacterized protein BXZ73DRAFT_96020 [Epithele typhae]KAH9945032.1 hypothetical protein BXZ73DRAFT_96020 [Epithele typhae]
MPLLIDSAELAGLAAEGVFVCLFCVCGYDLVRRRARYKSQLSWPMVVAGVLLIVLATARFAVDTANVFVAFIHHDPRPARLGYLEDVTAPLFRTKHTILIAVLLVGDSFVNYRCWVVWGKSLWVVILPVTLSLSSAAIGAYAMWAYNTLPDQTVLAEARLLKAFFSLSLIANALATSLLAFRIWWVDREMNNVLSGSQTAELEGPFGGQQSALTPVVRIVLESGLINAAYLFAYVMTLAFGSQSLELMSEMAVPLTGIIFSIVILRVGQRRHDDSYYTTNRHGTTMRFAAQQRSTVGTDTGTDTTAMGSGAGGSTAVVDMFGKGHRQEKGDAFVLPIPSGCPDGTS